MHFHRFAFFPLACQASIWVMDLSDVIPTSAFAPDNAISPVYTIPGASPELPNVVSANVITQPQAFDHTVFNASFCEIVKSGGAKDVWSSEMVGHNAAVLLTNQSTGHFSFCNITSHSGAIGAVAIERSTLDLDRCAIYSTGPCAHGIWASLDGTVRGQVSMIQTNGLRSAAAGAGMSGSVLASRSILHTTGAYSSPLFFGTGQGWSLRFETVIGNADASPMGIFDGSGDMWLSDSQVTGRGIAGFVSTSTGPQLGAQVLQFNNNWLTSLGGSPIFWCSNVNTTIQLFRTTLTSDSSSQDAWLVVANRSQISTDYANYNNGIPAFTNTTISPAWVAVSVQESLIRGNLLSMLGSYIRWDLVATSVWYGSTYMANALNAPSYIDVTIAPDCTWVLTQNSVVRGFYAPEKNLTNVIGDGNNISYAGNHSLNGWLGGQTWPLQGGGFATPY
ncbi:hypothetical protein GQ53DRAFT_819828 [Thozetella sp. PMI_491]|nr:hypothetical protein GQ53DRAFT_819828 [Thozetella sp. PMI_491]